VNLDLLSLEALGAVAVVAVVVSVVAFAAALGGTPLDIGRLVEHLTSSRGPGGWPSRTGAVTLVATAVALLVFISVLAMLVVR